MRERVKEGKEEEEGTGYGESIEEAGTKSRYEGRVISFPNTLSCVLPNYVDASTFGEGRRGWVGGGRKRGKAWGKEEAL